MHPVLFIVIALGVFALMEGVAWWAHKYVMHGWGWAWHESHHRPRTGAFELNDLYAVVGSASAIALFALAWATGSGLAYAVATGITLYGVAYALFHDGLVHQRWPFWWVPRSGYLRRLIQAHRLHHATTNRGDAVSFGFLAAPDPHALHAELKQLRARRRQM